MWLSTKSKSSKGVSLVEILISLVLFSITLPIIYNTLFNTQSYLMGADAEVKLEMEANIATQYIIKDIKEATIIYDRKIKDAESFKTRFLDDAVAGTEFTDKNGLESSAIILMKYAGNKIMPEEASNKKVSQYEVIAYYMKLLPRSDSFYDSTLKMRSILRLNSEQLFIDPSPLTLAEREWALSKGYYFWAPPKKGFMPDFPSLQQLTMRKLKLTVNTSPAGFKIKGTTVPVPGGLIFIQNENSISITLSSVRRTTNGIKSFSQKSFATATSLIN